MANAPRYHFAGWEFDPASGVLTGSRSTTRLEPQPARVLGLLLAKGGQLVSREELQREVWGDTHVDLDAALNYCIRQIRAALEDRAEAPRFLETLPRRGYRFLPAVETSATETAPGRESRRPRQVAFGLAAGLLVVAALALWALYRVAGAPPAPEVRLAVLPFHGLDVPATDWENRFTQALVVEFTRQGRPGLAVLGPATTAGEAAVATSETALGRKLGVDYLVSGGARRDGATVFVQLVRVADGKHLWAAVRPLEDPDRLASAVVAEALTALAAASDPLATAVVDAARVDPLAAVVVASHRVQVHQVTSAVRAEVGQLVSARRRVILCRLVAVRTPTLAAGRGERQADGNEPVGGLGKAHRDVREAVRDRRWVLRQGRGERGVQGVLIRQGSPGTEGQGEREECDGTFHETPP